MATKASHDRYGKELLRTILGKRWVNRFDDRKSLEMGGVRADLDGIILSENLLDVECAVEIEATVYTQARAALFNLALHPTPKKLFVVILAHTQMGTKKKSHSTFFVCLGKNLRRQRNSFRSGGSARDRSSSDGRSGYLATPGWTKKIGVNPSVSLLAHV